MEGADRLVCARIGVSVVPDGRTGRRQAAERVRLEGRHKCGRRLIGRRHMAARR